MGLFSSLDSIFNKISNIHQVKPRNITKPFFLELSDVGGRDKNQDFSSHLFTERGTLLVVADGLGGHDGGELASRLFCEAVTEYAKGDLDKLVENSVDGLSALAKKSAHKMTEIMLEKHPGIQAHTTCVIAWVSLPDYVLTTLHIGDSRIYRINNNKVVWRSRDHSVVQMLVDAQELTEDEMGLHEEQGSLTRSISVGNDIKPSVKRHVKPMEEDEVLLLCTDGFWEVLSRKQILSIFNTTNLQKNIQKWVSKAIKLGGKNGDNLTLQVYISH